MDGEQAPLRRPGLSHRSRVILVLCFTIIPAAVAAVICLLLPIQYATAASVAIVRNRTELTFQAAEERGADRLAATTVDESTILAFLKTQQNAQQERAARRETYVAMVQNETIERSVVTRLDPILAPGEKTPGALSEMVTGSLAVNTGASDRDKCDLIRISVRGEDAKKVASIANAWAEEFVTAVNDIFTEKGGHEDLVRNTDDAERAYVALVEEVIRFNRENRLDQTSHTIEHLKQVISKHWTSRQDLLNAALADKMRLETIIARARALRDHARQGGSETTSAIALAMFKCAAFGDPDRSRAAESELPARLEMRIDNLQSLTPSAFVGDTEAILAALEAEQAEVQKRILAYSDTVSRPSGAMISPPSNGASQDGKAPTIEEMEEQLAALEERNNLLMAKQAELIERRQFALLRWQTLARKAIEYRVSSELPNSEVRFAARAPIPLTPINPKALNNGALAGGFGFLAGLAVLVFLEYLARVGAESRTVPPAVGQQTQ